MISPMKIISTVLKTLGISEEEIRQALSGPIANMSARPAADLPGRPRGHFSQVYLLLDTSSSMDEGRKLSQARKGGRKFAADAIEKGYSVGVISFSDKAEVRIEPTTRILKIEMGLAVSRAEGSTNMAAAIELAAERLVSRNCDRAIVLVTDGFPNHQEATLHAAENAKRRGITIIAIGTDDADREFLGRLASARGLSQKVKRQDLHVAIADSARLLPAKKTK